ncbi:hypothetical protein RclHR1_17260004 [Rhizophagus clarus]|uniref:Uncharacterized protein n=1 Tax=Rhizophagus clarus TaxID=94130 RepID=A0A2Z6RCT2_9GLOM|nr:hypothetical protein RclHR1_17260004 [Rhizophagus clarus]
MPVYAIRAMRREFVNTCDTFLDNAEKFRVYIITDLQHFNEGRISIYDTFWEYAKKFLESTAQDSVIAVDERRHDPIVHLARAISVEDLKNQIAKLCPEGIPIPSVQWLRLQFWLKNPWNKSSLQFTGILPLKFMIQICEEMEKLINRCNSLEDIWKKAKINSQLEKELLQNIEPTRNLLSNIFTCQNLKDEPFKIFEPATKTEMETFWESVHLVDDSITIEDTSQKKVADKISPKLQEFMEHCCRKRQYFFEIKKCGSGECDICRPIKSDADIFKELKECNKPRILYARHKISEEEFCLLQSFLESIEYTCGVTFKGLSGLSFSRKESDVNINNDDEKENNNRDTDINEDNEKENYNGSDPVVELFKIVQINKKHTCSSAIEKPYFVENELPYCEEYHALAGEKRKMGKRKYFDGGN